MERKKLSNHQKLKFHLGMCIGFETIEQNSRWYYKAYTFIILKPKNTEADKVLLTHCENNKTHSWSLPKKKF